MHRLKPTVLAGSALTGAAATVNAVTASFTVAIGVAVIAVLTTLTRDG